MTVQSLGKLYSSEKSVTAKNATMQCIISELLLLHVRDISLTGKWAAKHNGSQIFI